MEADRFVERLLSNKEQDSWLYPEDDSEEQELTEYGFSTYKRDLEDYEERLARGDISW